MKNRIAVKNTTLAAAGSKRKRGWLAQTRSTVALCALAGALGTPLGASAQALLVGDGVTSAVDGVDVRSGASLGAFVAPTDGQHYLIDGPRGMIFLGKSLLVASQNPNGTLSGAILKFDAGSGAFQGNLVPDTDPNAPFDPRGVIAGPEGTIYVADLGNADGASGFIKQYDLHGRFLGSLDTTGFQAPFNPRGLVIGPDGLLYVSVVGNLATGDRAPGYIIRFAWNRRTRNYSFHDVFVASTPANNYASGLHRPEGLVFDPRGHLYVTSFKQAVTIGTVTRTDPDQILVFDRHGRDVGQIVLDDADGTRHYGQALLFGPEADLFLPLTSDVGVRRYSAHSGYQQYVVLPATASDVQLGWYLTFRHTNPWTLEYEGWDGHEDGDRSE